MVAVLSLLFITLGKKDHCLAIMKFVKITQKVEMETGIIIDITQAPLNIVIVEKHATEMLIIIIIDSSNQGTSYH